MKTRRLVSLLVSAGLVAASAAEMRVERDVAYAEPRNERQLLDVYAPASGTKMPVVVWVHGGGWVTGSKAMVAEKPAAFNGKGLVFVAMNYRFVPAVQMGDIVRDVAKSVGWVRANIARYGGDPDRILLMGHSAGAQLAALLCTDWRYLQAEKVPPASIVGCVPVDGDTYDVPLQVATATARRKSLKQPPPKMGHPEKFGDLAKQREYSAVNHVARGKGIPPFLLLHVADHTDTTAQAQRMWAALDAAGVRARVYGAENSEHVKLDRQLGVAGDPATRVLMEFVDEVLRPRSFTPGGQQVLLWPDGAPGSEGKTAPERWIAGSTPDAFHRVTDVHRPSITVYLAPKEKANGAAFVVMPGGGHRYLVMDLEGEFVAQKLNEMGVAAFVVKSRLERAEGSTYKAEVESLADVQRAVRLVRSRATEWGVDVRRVGVMGFSAGGHLAALAANRFDEVKAGAADAVDRMSSRPDFAVLGYPAYITASTLTAKDPPPTFIFVNNDDNLAAASGEYYLALKKARASAEMHVFRRGGHGVGMTGRGPEFAGMPEAMWPDLLRAWMADLGYLR